jgi:hypothetical protein
VPEARTQEEARVRCEAGQSAADAKAREDSAMRSRTATLEAARRKAEWDALPQAEKDRRLAEQRRAAEASRQKSGPDNFGNPFGKTIENWATSPSGSPFDFTR